MITFSVSSIGLAYSVHYCKSKNLALVNIFSSKSVSNHSCCCNKSNNVQQTHSSCCSKNKPVNTENSNTKAINHGVNLSKLSCCSGYNSMINISDYFISNESVKIFFQSIIETPNTSIDVLKNKFSQNNYPLKFYQHPLKELISNIISFIHCNSLSSSDADASNFSLY